MCKRDNSHCLRYFKNLSIMPLGISLVICFDSVILYKTDKQAWHGLLQNFCLYSLNI